MLQLLLEHRLVAPEFEGLCLLVSRIVAVLAVITPCRHLQDDYRRVSLSLGELGSAGSWFEMLRAEHCEDHASCSLDLNVQKYYQSAGSSTTEDCALREMVSSGPRACKADAGLPMSCTGNSRV